MFFFCVLSGNLLKRFDANKQISLSLSLSKAKRRLEIKLAEARLQRVRQKKELRRKQLQAEEELRLKQLQAEEESRLKQLQLDLERALLPAEADVTEANLIADASSTCSDLSVPESVAPRLSVHEKVMEYLHNIPTNERQGQSRKEKDLQRGSPGVTYALSEDKTEIRGRGFLELCWDQCHISCILHRLFEILAVFRGRPFALLVLPRHLKLLRTTLLVTELPDYRVS